MNLLQLILIFFVAFIAIIIVTAEPQIEDLVDIGCDTAAECDNLRWPNKNVSCIDGKCVCDRSDDGTRIECEVNPMVGRVNNVIAGNCPCDQIENSKCDLKQNICLCEADYVTSIDKRRCIKGEVKLNETCEHNGQCLKHDKFSFCELENKTCQCQLNFIDHEGVCFGSVRLNHKCIDDSQCLKKTLNSKCVLNKCLCVKNFVPSSIHSKCLPAADYKQSCEESYQCRSKLGIGSECYSGLCTCDSVHTLIKANDTNQFFCERKINIGDICHEHNECYQSHLNINEQAMECIQGECKCRSNFKISKDLICERNGESKILFNSMLLILVFGALKYLSF